MKLKEKFTQFFIVMLMLLISYSLCSTHELPSQGQGYISRRKRFCGTPIYIYVFIAFILIFLIYK